MAVNPESRCIWVLYDTGGGPPLWHQRWVAGRVASTAADYVIVTLDGDLYVESYDGTDVGIWAHRWSHQMLPPPAGIPRANTYRFPRAPSAAHKSRFQQDALRVARAHCDSLARAGPPPAGYLRALGKAGPAGGWGGAAAAAPPPAPADNRAWVALEEVAGLSRGSVVTIVDGDVIRGDAWIHYERGEAVLVRRVSEAQRAVVAGGEKDARVLALELTSLGDGGVSRRRQPWRNVCDLLREDTYKDWPVPGPRTVRWCCTHINRRGGGPQDHHRVFNQAYGVSKGDWGVDAHGVALRALEEAGCYDASWWSTCMCRRPPRASRRRARAEERCRPDSWTRRQCSAGRTGRRERP